MEEALLGVGGEEPLVGLEVAELLQVPDGVETAHRHRHVVGGKRLLIVQEPGNVSKVYF